MYFAAKKLLLPSRVETVAGELRCATAGDDNNNDIKTNNESTNNTCYSMEVNNMKRFVPAAFGAIAIEKIPGRSISGCVNTEVAPVESISTAETVPSVSGAKPSRMVTCVWDFEVPPTASGSRR